MKSRVFVVWVSMVSSLVGGVAILPDVCRAQAREERGLPDLEALRSSVGSRTRALEITESIPLDAPVQASEYVVGPGDRLAVQVFSTTPFSEMLTVTPEGFLIIPGVPTLTVRDRTLSDVRTMITAALGRSYARGEISVALLSPRKVSVTILGAVPTEGKKTVYASQRVEDLIEMGNEMPTSRFDADGYEVKLNELRANRSERKIVLQRRSGERRLVDLSRYRATGVGKYNPYLAEGDVVFVPTREPADNVIAVYGCMNRHASFEFIEGDSLSLLVAMGMGLAPNADPAHATLARLSTDGRRMDTLTVDVLGILERRAPDVALRPGDRLLVPVEPYRASNFYATVEGEVMRPGDIPISSEGTRLSSLVSLSGGFTERANLRGAVVYRLKADPSELKNAAEQERLLSLRASLSFQDTTYYQIESALRVRGEIVVVDFTRLFMEGDSSADITLRPFDRVVIPARQQTVYVFGQVMKPGHVVFSEGMNCDGYIDRAGGFTGQARTGEVMIIKQGTRVWLDPSETTVEDGDMVWVPKDREYPFSYHVSIWAQIAGIVGTAATVALLVNSFK